MNTTWPLQKKKKSGGGGGGEVNVSLPPIKRRRLAKNVFNHILMSCSNVHAFILRVVVGLIEFS